MLIANIYKLSEGENCASADEVSTVTVIRCITLNPSYIISSIAATNDFGLVILFSVDDARLVDGCHFIMNLTFVNNSFFFNRQN
jgi:hypothetical protein